MKIVFMGTPDFAVPCLEGLFDSSHRVLAVFSQPDKPKGRKLQTAPTPVKACALAHQVPVYQPVSLREGEVLQRLKELNPDVIVVVAYGKMLPAEILHLPPFGCVNVHGSLLPKYRGAAPIQWAILNGEKETGITVMHMEEGMDTGPMLLMEKTPIDCDENTARLFERLSILGADALIKALMQLEKGELTPTPQDETQATYTKKIDKSMCAIDWNRTAAQIHNQIRGLAGWPVALTTLNGKNLKIHTSVVSDKKGNHIGEVVENRKQLVISCGGGTALELIEIQLEGKKRMQTSDFLLGNPIELGETLGV